MHLFQIDGRPNRAKKLEGLPTEQNDSDSYSPATIPLTVSGSGAFLVLQVQNEEDLGTFILSKGPEKEEAVSVHQGAPAYRRQGQSCKESMSTKGSSI